MKEENKKKCKHFDESVFTFYARLFVYEHEILLP